MSVFDKDGKVLARWGTPEKTAPGSFAAPHGLALDSKNDLYVSEVTWTFAVNRGRVAEDCPTRSQKFSIVSRHTFMTSHRFQCAILFLPFAPQEIPLGDKGRTEVGMGLSMHQTIASFPLAGEGWDGGAV